MRDVRCHGIDKDSERNGTFEVLHHPADDNILVRIIFVAFL